MVKAVELREMPKPKGMDTTANAHKGVSMKVLVDKSTGSKHMWVGIGQFSPGGKVEMHQHGDSEHCYYALKGDFTVIDENGKHLIKEGTGCWIGLNEPHGMANEGQETAVYVCVSAPSSM
jgi:quercetin dioxygenase-like cupin family protein